MHRSAPQRVWAAPRGLKRRKTCQRKNVRFLDLGWGEEGLRSDRGKEGKNLVQACHLPSKSGFCFSPGRKTFPSAMNFQPCRSRTGIHCSPSCCNCKKNALALCHARRALGSSSHTKAKLLWGPALRAEDSSDKRDSRGDRRGAAQDGAGSVELWAMLAIKLGSPHLTSPPWCTYL